MIRQAGGALATAVLLVGATAVGAAASGATGVSATATGAKAARARAARAAAFTPQPGALFNWPTGTPAEQLRIISNINRTIKSTPPGSAIRIAQYSFDREDIADSLVAAYRRGVTVQMLLNDNWTTRQTLRLQRVIGSDRTAPSFVYICHSSCRGPRGNLHSKFYLFTQAGQARNVVMFGSANLTDNSAYIQWNDMFTVRSGAMLDLYTAVFDAMVPDQVVPHPYLAVTVGDLENDFYPHYDTTVANDPVAQRLRAIGCHASGGTGLHGHSVIRLAMFGWSGPRGGYLADRIAGLRRHGCNVKAIVSSTGGHVVRTLRAADVPVRSASFDRNGNGTIDLYGHTKYMLLSGRYQGVSTWNVWTGSANWSDVSFNNDETTVRIPRRPAYRRYLHNFNRLWLRARQL